MLPLSRRAGSCRETVKAPVATDQAIKLFLCLVALKGLVTRQLNVVTAYLNAKLQDHQVYMRQPTGFAVPGKVCLLKQALYGFRQSAFLWYECFAAALKDLGFRPLKDDICVFTRRDGSSYIIIYVDNAPLQHQRNRMRCVYWIRPPSPSNLRIWGPHRDSLDVRYHTTPRDVFALIIARISRSSLPWKASPTLLRMQFQ